MVEMVSSSPITWKKDDIELSISVGLAEYCGASTPEEITNRSDRALYSAKKAGKNNVKIFNTTDNE